MDWTYFLNLACKTLKGFAKAVFGCNHSGIKLTEGKVFCPHCTQGLILRWVQLRCAQCNQKRGCQYVLREITPTERCCLQCGHSQFVKEYLENPAYFHLDKALLEIEEEASYLATHPWNFNSQAWIYPNQKTAQRLRLSVS